MNAVTKKKSGAAWVGVLLLIAVLCFVGLVVVQVMEIKTYSGPVSVWPS